jgi:hypothetical protein
MNASVVFTLLNVRASISLACTGGRTISHYSRQRRRYTRAAAPYSTDWTVTWPGPAAERQPTVYITLLLLHIVVPYLSKGATVDSAVAAAMFIVYIVEPGVL